jgi:hypothetical protein
MQEPLSGLIDELNETIKGKERDNIGLERATKKLERDLVEGEQV